MPDIKQRVALSSIAASAGLDRGQGRGRPRHRLARNPVGSRPFAARSGRDGDDLFRGAHFRQARRRGAPLRPRQGRKRVGAGGDRAAVPALRHRDLGGAAAPVRRARPRGRGDLLGVRGDRRLDRHRLLSRAPALQGRRRDIERGAGSGRPAFRLGHVVVGGGAGGTGRRRARLSLGRLGCRGHRRGVHLRRRLAARPAHHRHPYRYCAGRRRRQDRGRR